jgi:hypothetical protein
LVVNPLAVTEVNPSWLGSKTLENAAAGIVPFPSLIIIPGVCDIPSLERIRKISNENNNRAIADKFGFIKENDF